MTAAARPTRWIWAAAIVVALIRPYMLINHFLVQTPPTRWLVDLEVYRNAGISNLIGRPVYEAVTAPPQLLPFTYPPIASIIAILLALIPFALAGWLWTFAQFAVLGALVWWLFREPAQRCGQWWPLVLAGIWTAVGCLQPVGDGIKFGQVNIFLMALVLLDLAGRSGRIPRGVLIGLATSIKLTPGIFIVHLLVTRQWRAAATAAGSAAGFSLVSFVLLPNASFAFWGGALQDPGRLGLNDGTSNQALRGMLLRAHWDSTALWLFLVLVVMVLGLGTARLAYQRGWLWHEAAAVGLVGVLVSPVSWIHHFVWVMVALAALLQVRKLLAAAIFWLLFTMPLPWWGQWRLQQGLDFPASSSGNPGWQLLNDSYGLIAVLLLGVLAWSLPAVRRRVATPDSRPAERSAVSP
ncbi:glycosyltransferase 87 family protein [Branchiibius sp. NY16-3462-2]|uniref:glycosyltransferase 87 family protein n=1 Tax=Branchiibius sp. NY16-3462-2 TaxID=1807500 RepID=UPI0025C72E28|nr:glycosyltransferase 87 family protein [Branchiibius sp. NY16-3462-2]